jgi:hypothetical protein
MTLLVTLITTTVFAVLAVLVDRKIRNRPVTQDRIFYEIAETVQALLFEDLPERLTKWGGLTLDGDNWAIVIQFTDPADRKIIPTQRNGVKIIPQLIQA